MVSKLNGNTTTRRNDMYTIQEAKDGGVTYYKLIRHHSKNSTYWCVGTFSTKERAAAHLKTLKAA